jgi:orotate phosphoribosyltransferase
MKPNILKMGKEQILTLDPYQIGWLMSSAEVVHIAKELGALWQYDYKAAKAGKHAILKSERHSDQFFVSKILLQYENILEIMARQIVFRLKSMAIPRPHVVIGIPDGATKLGEKVAGMFGARLAKMTKNSQGRLVLEDEISVNETVLLVEDFCTKGTGFKEAVRLVRASTISKTAGDVVSHAAKHAFMNPKFLKVDPVIMNRGGLKYVVVQGSGKFRVAAAVEYRVNDWSPMHCPLCKKGSIPIKPKASEDNWLAITESQM